MDGPAQRDDAVVGGVGELVGALADRLRHALEHLVLRNRSPDVQVVAQLLDARRALGDRLGLLALVGQANAAAERHGAVAGVDVHRLGGQRVVGDEGFSTAASVLASARLPRPGRRGRSWSPTSVTPGTE